MGILNKIVNEEININGIKSIEKLYEINPFKILNYCSNRQSAIDIEKELKIDIESFLPSGVGYEIDVDGVKYIRGMISGIFLEYKHCYSEDLFQTNPFSWGGKTEHGDVINADDVQKAVSNIVRNSDVSVQALVDNFSSNSDFMFPSNNKFYGNGFTKHSYLNTRKGKGGTWLIVHPYNIKSFSIINFTKSQKVKRLANRFQKALFKESSENEWSVRDELRSYLHEIGKIAKPCFTQFMYNVLTLYRLGESETLIDYILNGENRGYIDIRNTQDSEFMDILKEDFSFSSGKSKWEVGMNRGRFSISMIGLFEIMLELISDKTMYKTPKLYLEFADSLENAAFDWVSFLGRIRKEKKGSYIPMGILENHLDSVQV